MKKYAMMCLVFGLLLAGCSDEPDVPTEEPVPPVQETPDDEEQEEEPEEPLIDLTPMLCNGQRFIERETDGFTSPTFGNYTAVTVQNEYQFYENGTGTLTRYIAENTPRGFVQSVKNFNWESEPSLSPSLEIAVEGGERFKLNNVEVVEKGLFSSEVIWTKELSLDSPLQKEDVVSYSIDMKHGKDYDYSYGGMLCLLTSPAQLTVETEEGSVTFITHLYGASCVLNAVPAFDYGNGLEYYKSYVYAEVDIDSPYPYSFFEIQVESKEKPFIENDNMYFYLGTFDPDTETFSLIESGKDYQVNN